MTPVLDVRMLREPEASRAVEYLSRDPLPNLFLLDLLHRRGAPAPPGEMRTEIAVALRNDELVGVAALRPTIVFDAAMDPAVACEFLPLLDTMRIGLVKCGAEVVDAVWGRLGRARRRRSILDRYETAYALAPEDARRVDGPDLRVARSAWRRGPH